MGYPFYRWEWKIFFSFMIDRSFGARVLQAITMRKYSAQLSLTTLICFVGTLQSIAVTFVVEHSPHVWAIGWDMNLLAAAYAVSLHLSS